MTATIEMTVFEPGDRMPEWVTRLEGKGDPYGTWIRRCGVFWWGGMLNVTTLDNGEASGPVVRFEGNGHDFTVIGAPTCWPGSDWGDAKVEPFKHRLQ